jgi:mannan endo-1,4-beta-mannosidase
VLVAGVGVGMGMRLADRRPARSALLPTVLPTAPASYVGLYAQGAPQSFAGVTSFTGATDVRPNLVSYYSGWFEPFQTGFAQSAAEHHAVTLVQIDPTNVSLAAIAAGRYDPYLVTYAKAVRSFGLGVILSFGHEMNGNWYSWGYRHTPPATFVAAWRHIVRVFRSVGARNVTWLWTVNVEPKPNPAKLSSLALWWPGKDFVTWVGLDGYYLHPSSQFAQVFGSTVLAVREVTRDPILISETAAVPAAGQPAKIKELFAGIRTYGLLGFIWFNAQVRSVSYQIASPQAVAAFRRAAQTYRVHAF